jgi:hypothetical protein
VSALERGLAEKREWRYSRDCACRERTGRAVDIQSIGSATEFERKSCTHHIAAIGRRRSAVLDTISADYCCFESQLIGPPHLQSGSLGTRFGERTHSIRRHTQGLPR